MTPAKAVKSCIAKAFRFSGRASRSEFWWFAFFACCVGIAAMGYANALAEKEYRTAGEPILIWGVVFATPLFSAAFRRMQDSGKSGFWIIVPLMIWLPMKLLLMVSVAAPTFGSGAAIMLLGPIWLLLTLVIGSFLSGNTDSGRNRYGPPPSEVTP